MVSTRAARFTLAGLAGLILVGLGAALDAESWHTSAVNRGVTSEENDELLRQSLERGGLSPEQTTKLLAESFVAGPATNVQFMVKDSKRYASTGGWGFAQCDDGKPADEAVHKTCISCHEPVKERDFVFTRYAQ